MLLIQLLQILEEKVFNIYLVLQRQEVPYTGATESLNVCRRSNTDTKDPNKLSRVIGGWGVVLVNNYELSIPTPPLCPNPRASASRTWVPQSKLAFGHHKNVGSALLIKS